MCLSKFLSAVAISTLSLMAWPAYCAVPNVFINELHYDNVGADAGEAFEIAGPAGTDLTGWSVVLYNGNGGAVYGTIPLAGAIPNLSGGFGVITFAFAGLQNGSPDGLALVDGTSTLIQFLSYEGAFTGVGGVADLILSTDIGVSEGSSTPVGYSLQLVGSGALYADFSWAAEQAHTFGAFNTGQTFTGGVETAPSISSTNPADTASGVAAGASITVNFSEPVNVAGSWFDIGCTISGSHTAVVSGGPTAFSLDPDTDFSFGETCTVTVFATQVTDQDTDDPPDNLIADFVFSFDTVVLSYIHDVQGNGAASPLVGNTVLIEGIVVGDFQDGASGTNGDLNGFHVQEEDADADADSTTSEGIFVFNGSSPAVNVQIGDLVQVVGAVSEFNGMTEITSFTGVTVVSSGNVLPTASALSLPVLNVNDFEAYEGMLVTFAQALVISEYFNFDRFGEIILTSQRHLTPTAEFNPGAAAIAAADAFLLDKITLDDGRTTQNPNPAIHPNGSDFDLTNLFRGGDTVANVTGVVDYSFGLYRIQPTQGADYTSVNPRMTSPGPVGGSIKVASFNVLNYFSTLDDGVNDICGPAQNQECRGADNAGEFTRQRDKIIAALTAIDADVVGLLEIENNVTDDAVIDLVNGLNAANGAGTYDHVSTGTIGTDAIKVALIYQPASVSPVGLYAILDSLVDPGFDDTKNRPVLAQSFADSWGGGVFTIAVNHFKSKGSACDDADAGDGSGNCNLTRAAAALALADWLASDPTGSGDTDALIIGDLNSYDKEDPIVVLVDAGYTDLAYIFGGESAYSYVFDGQIGYLDYALASPNLFDQVTGATEWHINADEPDLIDYDTSFKQPAQDAIYAPDAYRSSDHDPVIVGMELLHYDFSGFSKPVKNPPAVNSEKAGSTVKIKFETEGGDGEDAVEEGYPRSQPIACDWDLGTLGPSEEIDMKKDKKDKKDKKGKKDKYEYEWKTEKDWKGSCRRLDVLLRDGIHHYAYFTFK